MLAASPGLEPRLTESESAVLPLDDEAIFNLSDCCIRQISKDVKHFYKNYFTFVFYMLNIV